MVSTNLAFIYEQAAKGSAATCYGPACLTPTHIVISSLCGAAAVATGVLAMRSTVLYRREVLLAVELEG